MRLGRWRRAIRPSSRDDTLTAGDLYRARAVASRAQGSRVVLLADSASTRCRYSIVSGYGGHPAMAAHSAIAGIVGGEREAHIAIVLIEQQTQVADATLDVLARIEDAPDVVACAPWPA